MTSKPLFGGELPWNIRPAPRPDAERSDGLPTRPLDPQRLAEAIWNDGNPWTWSTEGLDDCCFFCDRDDPGERAKNTMDPADLHDPDCVWLDVAMARQDAPRG